MYIYMYIYIYMCVCVYVCVYVCLFPCVCVCYLNHFSYFFVKFFLFKIYIQAVDVNQHLFCSVAIFNSTHGCICFYYCRLDNQFLPFPSSVIIMNHNKLTISYHSYYSLQTTVHMNELELHVTFTPLVSLLSFFTLSTIFADVGTIIVRDSRN